MVASRAIRRLWRGCGRLRQPLLRQYLVWRLRLARDCGLFGSSFFHEEFEFDRAHRTKGTTMNCARTDRPKCSEMLRRGVAFMLGESVVGILAIHFGHEPIPGDFGEHAGSGNGIAARVTLH